MLELCYPANASLHHSNHLQCFTAESHFSRRRGIAPPTKSCLQLGRSSNLRRSHPSTPTSCAVFILIMMNISPVEIPGTSIDDHHRRCNRRVTFVRRTYIYNIPSLQEFTDDEISQTWLTPQDEERIQNDMIQTVTCMRKGNLNTGMCTRGLEHLKSSERTQRRVLDKKRVAHAVLAEQSNQFQKGIYSSKNIAAISSALSQRSRDRAVLLAENDARDANAYMNE